MGGDLAVRARALGALSLVGALPALFLMCLTGFMMVYREFGLYHQMLDPEQFEMADYLLANVPPKGVILHRDIHISPAGCLSGRISLIGYNGWMWSHGYNYNERERDRAYVLDNALKDSDTTAYNILRRWGVRYVLGENLKTHHRPAAQAYEEALARGNPENITYDADAYLDGQLKSTKKIGRYELLEVQGYGELLFSMEGPVTGGSCHFILSLTPCFTHQSTQPPFFHHRLPSRVTAGVLLTLPLQYAKHCIFMYDKDLIMKCSSKRRGWGKTLTLHPSINGGRGWEVSSTCCTPPLPPL